MSTEAQTTPSTVGRLPRELEHHSHTPPRPPALQSQGPSGATLAPVDNASGEYGRFDPIRNSRGPNVGAGSRSSSDTAGSGFGVVGTAPLKILLVDDEPHVRHMLRRMLKPPHTVLEASGGRQAVEALQRDASVQFILSDINMPDGDGLMLQDELSRVAPQLVRRILFISGAHSSSGAMQLASRTGARILAKPFTRDEVLREIARVVQAANSSEL